MKEPPKHITEPFCENCLFFKKDESCENEVYVFFCLNQNKKLFKTDMAKPEGWCVYHEIDPDKKKQLKGKL